GGGSRPTLLQLPCRVSCMCMDLPLTRGECKHVPRPCPYERCRHHMGRACYNGTNCSLDLAEQGGMSPREVAKALGLKVKQVLEIERVAMERVRNGLQEKD